LKQQEEKELSTAPELKTFEIVYTMPGNLMEDTGIAERGVDKSLNFHRFMRHARECHRNLLEFLVQNDLMDGTGGSSLVANERRTLIECTEAIAARLSRLPYVAKAAETQDALPQQAATLRRHPPLQGR
jgi:hypothetical protein